jgi:hypothetical protein
MFPPKICSFLMSTDILLFRKWIMTSSEPSLLKPKLWKLYLTWIFYFRRLVQKLLVLVDVIFNVDLYHFVDLLFLDIIRPYSEPLSISSRLHRKSYRVHCNDRGTPLDAT